MSFLNPLLLFGLLSLAVPLILLFFLNRKRIILYWAAYEWMNQTVVRHERQLRISDLLKLIAKLLLLAALVLMVARPFLRAYGGRGRTLVVLDVSPSMGAKQENETRLVRARKDLEQFLTEHPGRVAVDTFGGRLEPLVNQFTDDRAFVKGELGRVELSPRCAGASTLLQELAADPRAREASQVVVFGDFQKQWYGDGAQVAEKLTRLGHAYPLAWVQTEAETQLQNCGIAGMSCSREGVFLGRTCYLEVLVYNGTAKATEERALSLLVDNEVKARILTRFSEHEQKSIPFGVNFTQPGWHELRAELDNDGLAADNVWYAAVEVPPPVRILLVTPPQGDAPFPFETYVKAAITGLLPKEAVVCRTVPALALADAKLDGLDLLVTVNLPLREGTPAGTAARDFVHRGGGLVAFLPGRAGDEAGAFGVAADAVTEGGAVASNALKGGYLEFMNDPGLKPEEIRFNQSLIFKDVPPVDVRLTVQKGPTGMVKREGKGVAVLLGFIPYHGATNFHFNPNFVQAVLGALWEARNFPGFFSYAAELKTWNARPVSREHNYTLQGAIGNPETLAVEGMGEQAHLVMPPNLKPGTYRILADSEELARFGFNADTRDCDLEPVTDNDLRPAMDQGLRFGPVAALGKLVRRVNLIPLTALLLLAAIALEAYAHFYRTIR